MIMMAIQTGPGYLGPHLLLLVGIADTQSLLVFKVDNASPWFLSADQKGILCRKPTDQKTKVVERSSKELLLKERGKIFRGTMASKYLI